MASGRAGRIIAYDALRVFAIVTVVAIHTLMPYRDIAEPTSAVRLFDDLLHYAVPLFVFISGALVWSRPLPAEKGAFATFMRRRATLIGIPYLAWAALYLAIYLAQARDLPAAALRAPGLILTGHVWYHLYFVPMLLTFYLMTPAATGIAKRSPELLVVLAYALRIGVGPEIASAFRTVFGDLGWSYATHIVTHLPHMALGAWFALRYPGWPAWVRRLWPLLLGVGTLVLLAAFAEWLPPLPGALRRLVFPVGMAATVLGLALLAFSLEPRLQRHATPIARAGALAFGVYFAHPLFLLGVDAVLARTSAEWLWLRWWWPVVVFAFATAGSFALSAGLAARQRTCWLVGVRAPERSAD